MSTAAETDPARRAPRWRRIALRAMLAAVVLAASLGGAALLSLRSAAVRQRVLALAGGAVEESAGIRAVAADFDLRWRRAEVEVRDLELAVPGERPFLTVPETVVAVSWPSLFGERIVIRDLRVLRPRLDLEAPLPAAGGEGAGEAGPSPAIDVERLRVTAAEVARGKAPPELEVWLDAFRATGVDVAGSYVSGRVEIELSGDLVAESRRRPPIEASLSAAAAGLFGGPIEVTGLELEGDGLRLSAEGDGEIARRAGSLRFDVDARPGRLFPDLVSGGRLEAAGEATLAGGRMIATSRLVARRLPGELLAPWLTGGDAAGLDPAGTEVDADAELEADFGDSGEARLQRLSGHVDLDWRRGDESLLRAELRAPGESAGGTGAPGAALAFAVEILPAEPGLRRLEGGLSAPKWTDFGAGELEETRIRLELPDLAAAARRLGIEAEDAGFRPSGSLRVRGTAAGPVAAPRLRLDAAWRLDGEPIVEVVARTIEGLALGRPFHLAFEADLLAGAAGRRWLAGELLAVDTRRLATGDFTAAELRDGRLELELPDLATAAEDLRRLWRRLLPGREMPAGLVEEGAGEGISGPVRGTLLAAGPVLSPVVELDAAWQPAARERVRVEGRGTVTADAPYFDGEARLAVDRLDLARFAGQEAEPGLTGEVSLALDFAGTPGSHRATLVLDGQDLVAGSGPAVRRLSLRAESEGATAEVAALDGSLATGQPFSGHGELRLATGPGGVPASPWITDGDFQLELARPIETLERAIASVKLSATELEAQVEIQEPGDEPRPVAIVKAPWTVFLGAEPPRPGNPSPPDPGRIWLGLSALELEPFVGLLGLEDDAPRPRATLDGALHLDLADLAASSGTIDISGLALEGKERDLAAAEPLRLVLAGHRLELLPGRLLAAGAGGGALEVSASFDLAPEWTPAGGLDALVSDLAVELTGSFDVSVLDPVLGGGRASGEAGVALTLRGPPAAPVAEGKIDGSQMTLFYAAPYGTRLEAPVVELSARRGNTVLESFQAKLNGGEVRARGVADRETGLALEATFRNVRYRLDHGLTVTAAGDLEVTRPRKGRVLLAGEVVVERGSLRRDLEIDREVLALLLAPDLTSTDEASLAAEVDLDLSVRTAEGVRVKNNLADLKADWSRLRVRGTLQNPLLDGRIEVVPGGRVTAYGQTVRIDEASLDFPGDPAVSPRLELETTSSLEDPSVRADRRRLSQSSLGDGGPGAGGFWDRRQDENASVSDELEKGLLTHYSDRVASTLGRGLGGTELSLEPLPIFGETDTQARLTATQRLSANADLIYSVNPRDAEGQTYILDLHGYDFAPGIRSQLFTNDDDNEGATLVHMLDLGGARGDDGPRLRRLAIEAPEGVSRRSLAKAIGLRKGDPLGEGAVFDAEVDAVEELRRQGYPGARVSATDRPAGRKVELGLAVEPGPRVDFEFEGEVPPRRDRRSIVQSYRLADEAASLEEIGRETVKALRGAGFLEPRAEVSVAVGESGSRTVRVLSEGGRRIDPGPPELPGLGLEESATLAAQFESRLARVELAAGAAGADRYLKHLLKALGYPRAEITGRELDEDGGRLVVHLVPGPRQHVREIEIIGLPAAEAARVRTSLPIAEGDPARSDLITRAAHAIEDDLRARGHAEAEVHTTLEAAGGAAPDTDLALRFAVDPGPEHRIADIGFEGLAGTRTSFAKRVAGLETGSLFRDADLSAARARLSRTGRFEGIRTTADAGEAVAEDAGGENTVSTPVVFEVTERPRYSVAYGGRWESGEGAGLVADVVDGNFLGRGTTLGLRAIYSGADERSVRLYGAAPRVLGTHAGLEVFVEGKNEDLAVQVEGETELVPSSSFEGWAQVTSPLGPRTQHRVYLRYQDIHFLDAVFEDGASVSGIDAEPETGERLVIPSLGWQLSFDTRSRSRGTGKEGSRDGLFFALDVVGTHEDLGSDYSVLGVFTQLKLFTTLADFGEGGNPRKLTWAQALRLGLQEPFADTAIPVVSRLRAGGEYSVRGYRTDTLGPLDESGTSLGGEVFLLLNEELRFPLWRDLLSGLLFFDAGNVWESRDALDSELFTAAGFGLRADTPAGRLRLDVAVPLDRRPDLDDDVKVYIGFGHVF